jgi:hypothetical protein
VKTEGYDQGSKNRRATWVTGSCMSYPVKSSAVLMSILASQNYDIILT